MYPKATSQAETQAYLWAVPELPVRVAIAPSVLAQLRAHVLAPAAAETGGLLIGRIDSDGTQYLTRVEAIEPLVIEHRHGPHFTLSGQDRRLLERQMRRRRRRGTMVVGFYRTHLRRGLYVAQRDYELFRGNFQQPGAVLLLACQDPEVTAKAGIFVWEDNDMRRHASYLEFPLDAPLTTVEPLSAPPITKRQTTRTQVPVIAKSDQWLKPAAIVVIGVGLPVLSFYLGRALAGSAKRQTGAIARTARPRVPSPGESQAKVAQVASAVPPVVAKPAPEPPVTPPAPAAFPPTAAEASAPKAANYSDRTAPPAKKLLKRKVASIPPVAAAASGPTLPEAPAVSAAANSVLPHSILRAAAPPAPRQRVEAFIKPVLKNRSGIRRIPLLRSLAGSSSADMDGFVPASPVTHPMPAIADAEIPERESTVELIARIDRSGSVGRVKYSDGDRQLTGASASALSRWRFEPARQNGAAVDSELVVRFEFHKKP